MNLYTDMNDEQKNPSVQSFHAVKGEVQIKTAF